MAAPHLLVSETLGNEFGFTVSILLERIDSGGVVHRVYRFVKADLFESALPKTEIHERQSGQKSDNFALAA